MISTENKPKCHPVLDITLEDVNALKNKVDIFNKNWHKKKKKKLLKELKEILLLPFPKVFLSDNVRAGYKKGKKFYRVRRLDNPDKITSNNDFWEPPIKRTNLGRLNNAKEPVLYLCYNLPTLAILESKLKKYDRFILMEYENQEEFLLNHIGQIDFPKKANNSEMLQIKDIKQNFINYWITKDDMNTKKIYWITNMIKDILYKEHDSIIGWSYKSIFGDEQFNLALNPRKAKEKLKLVSVWFCENVFDLDKVYGAFYRHAEIKYDNNRLIQIPFSEENRLYAVTTTKHFLNEEYLKKQLAEYLSSPYYWYNK